MKKQRNRNEDFIEHLILHLLTGLIGVGLFFIHPLLTILLLLGFTIYSLNWFIPRFSSEYSLENSDVSERGGK